MTYTIKKDDCTACENCLPQCPTQAIQLEPQSQSYWIDPTLCDGCPNVEIPRCAEVCLTGSLTRLKAKKGRYKSTLLPAAIPALFLNGKTSPFASSMVIWEACNILAQRQSLPWQTDDNHQFYYRRSVHRDRGEMRFRLATTATLQPPVSLTSEAAIATLSQFDIRATCLHLILAAHVVTLEIPWQETFILQDQQIEHYLGLDKRKDLTKLEKLTLIKELMHQACRIMVTIDWPRQGNVSAFSLAEHSVWQLLDTQYYFEDEPQGGRHLIGLSFTLRAGLWAQHFLNPREYRRQTAFYQYGTLPRSLLSEVMGNWQQHEGAMRLMLWLVFKLRLGGDHRMTIRTLLRIAYGEARVEEAMRVRGAYQRLLKTFESDLEALYCYGLKPIFDPETYPPEIQPLWARVAAIPEDAEDALAFWTEDAHQTLSLTDVAPRNKWQRLLKARLVGFDLSEDWQQVLRHTPRKQRRRQAKPLPSPPPLTGGELRLARERLNLSQRALAERLGKSQSWVRDIEKGRFSLNAEDYALLRQVLE